jgi:glycosyltransferase involved in cell wall biosynthesis
VKVLFIGDTSATGFGTVTFGLGTELLKLGLDVRFVSLNEGTDQLIPPAFEGRVAMLGQKNGWLSLGTPEGVVRTSQRVREMFSGGVFEDGWTPEKALVVGDVGSLKMSHLLEMIPEGFPIWHYVPIEGMDSPPKWATIWEHVSPVAMCEFGADEIERVTGSRPPVVYHGIDTESFWPVSPFKPIVLTDGKTLIKLTSKVECKRFFGVEGPLIFRADANMPRKMYASLLRSLAPVLSHHPEAQFRFHCRVQDQGGDLADEVSKYAIDIQNRMSPTGLYPCDRKLLNAMYNAADVYVSSSAEGFGLTIAEALACGTPVVGLGYSSVPEVVGNGGTCVPVGGLVDSIYSCLWARPDEGRFTEAVEFYITHPARAREAGMLGSMHVREFSWKLAAQQFAALLEQRVEVAA